MSTDRRTILKDALAKTAAAINAARPYSAERRKLHRVYDALIEEDIALSVSADGSVWRVSRSAKARTPATPSDARRYYTIHGEPTA